MLYNTVFNCDRRIYFKFSAWIQLANLMKRSGIECYVPKLPKRPSSDFVPYIFTPTQIEDMLKKADEIRVRRFMITTGVMAFPCLLRLLYSTGLRISEALSILNEDVHIEQQYIRIRSSKNGCDRLVPICDSMKESLLQYIHYRNRMPIDGISDNKRLLFVKCDGTALSSKTISHYFVDVLTQCGIPYIGGHHGPRLHDLRHTYAVHVLAQMARNGTDVYACLPILSTALGHLSLASTEHYVRLTASMFPEIEEQCSQLNSFVFPIHYIRR